MATLPDFKIEVAGGGIANPDVIGFEGLPKKQQWTQPEKQYTHDLIFWMIKLLKLSV
jgi:hypothetical protein